MYRIVNHGKNSKYSLKSRKKCIRRNKIKIFKDKLNRYLKKANLKVNILYKTRNICQINKDILAINISLQNS